MEKKLKQYLESGEIEYDGYGTQIWIQSEKDGSLHLADIRGWGHIQNMFPMNEKGQEQASKFQDSIGAFVVDAIKEKLERERSK